MDKENIPYLVRAATAGGLHSIFMEVHDNPSKALSDPNTVLNLKYLKILEQANIIYKMRLKIFKLHGQDNVE